MQSVPRDRDDRCPGVLRLLEAVDGRLARVRLPGGLLDAAGLRVLAAAAAELGDGRLELTSRGNVQLRALAEDAGTELGARLAAAGLWPSETHEQVRNIVASPLAGVDDGVPLEPFVHALDRALCADPALAALSGRFLFALDDGRGDVAALEPDVLAVVGDAAVPADVVAAMLDIARAFLAERAAQGSDAWRITDLDDGTRRVYRRAGTPCPTVPVRSGTGSEVGAIAQQDGGRGLTVLPPLGRLTAAQARGLADLLDTRADAARDVRVTPWRTVVVPDVVDAAAAQRAADMLGLVTDPHSPWTGVSACAGRPGCGKALADVQHDAARDVDRWPGSRVHWSGCERRCGRPRDTDVDVLATAGGYAITLS